MITNTPYDDVFRTLLNDCSSLIIPVINEMFGEHYSGQEKIVFSPNEHFLNQQGGNEEERITDTSFRIEGKETKKYHLECQSSTDNSMLVRFFEYDTQIALDEGTIKGNILTVTLPHSAVLFLRHHASTPDTLKIRMVTPGGTVEYERDQAKLKALQEEYEWIKNKLEELANQGAISEYTRCTIIDMSNKVLEHIAVKYDSVKEGVKAVMGGKILEYEAKTIKREGIEQGEDKLSRLITKLMENNRSQDVIKATQDKQYRNKLYAEYLIDQS